MTLITDVENRIETVFDAREKILSGLLSGLFIPSQAEENAAGAIHGLDNNIKDWAERGRVAAKSGKAPNTVTGWSGWVKAGQVFIDGMSQVASIGTYSTLENIKQTISEAPAVSAKEAIRITKKTAQAVGETTAALIKPLYVQIGIIAGVAVVAFWAWRRFGGSK